MKNCGVIFLFFVCVSALSGAVHIERLSSQFVDVDERINEKWMDNIFRMDEVWAFSSIDQFKSFLVNDLSMDISLALEICRNRATSLAQVDSYRSTFYGSYNRLVRYYLSIPKELKDSIYSELLSEI